MFKYKFIHSAGLGKNTLGKQLTQRYDNVAKRNFIEKFKFNIACENNNSNGYITEKIFDAFAVGTVPIYGGGGNKIYEIINKIRL